jgi:hypothetical protein
VASHIPDVRRVKTVLAAVATAALLAAHGSAQRWEGQPRDIELDQTARQPFDTCGTSRVRAQRLGFTALAALSDGRPVSFEQEPAVLTPDYTGNVTFRNFLVAGDVATVRFKLADSDSDRIETWTRTGTREIHGRFVSVFSPTWSSSTLAGVMRRQAWGWDYPSIEWGEFLPEGARPGSGFPIRLRMASSRLPQVQVRRIAADVQYSSHVVNLVVPGFASGRLGTDENAVDFPAITRRFYEHFEDSYDTITLTPQDVHVSGMSAFHVNVKNEVRGIGENIFNDSGRFGSGGRLQSVEMFYGTNLATNRISAHELAHQWGSYIDWTRLKGLPRAGHQPETHDPLWAEGETLLGSVLEGTRRVSRSGSGWVVERTPDPIRFHPLTRYAMGLISKEQVPEITLFNDQGQFGSQRSPEPGSGVNGATQSATVFNIIGMLGNREGPTPGQWHRAVVVVSREGLLSQKEMDYWTFFAQRTEDPNGTGVLSYDGFGSFDMATDRRIDLRHAVRPRTAGPIDQPLPVDFPDFAETDWRDVRFETAVASRYRTGERVRVSGRVTATDRNDYVQILLRFRKYGGSPDEAIQVRGPVSSAGSFILEHQFEPSQRGRYTMEVFLFWEGAPAQYPRASATVVTVE